MEKGVSPIIATLLILMVAISLGGAFFLFANNTFSDVSETAGREISDANQDLLAGIRVESVSGNNVYVRNTGGNSLAGSSIAVFIEGVPISINSVTPSTIQTDQIGDISLAVADIGPCNNQKHPLRVSVKSASDTMNVNITTSCQLKLA